MSISDTLNALDEATCRATLSRCCGAQRWVEGMLAVRPFEDDAGVFAAAEAVWGQMGREDILEAFTHHPKIGASLEQLRKKFATTEDLSSTEQSGVQGADEETLQALASDNEAYYQKFGYIFIVCATGKSARQMLDILRSRLPNDPDVELPIAAGEQAKITALRLEKCAS